MAVFLHPLGKYAHYHHHQLHLSLAQKPKKGFLMSVRARFVIPGPPPPGLLHDVFQSLRRVGKALDGELAQLVPRGGPN